VKAVALSETCIRCGQSDWRERQDGGSRQCNHCYRERARKWRDANRDYVNARARRYAERDREGYNAKQRARRLSDLDRYRAYCTAARNRNLAKFMLGAARKRARQFGLPFALTESDVVIPSHCPVLGIPLARGDGARTDASPTLDRIEPARGYVAGNVAVISWRANRIKSDGSLSELERIVAWMRTQAEVA
jgi:hypothetical protein